MKRIESKAKLLKKRVRAVQGKAKFVGMMYLLGLILLAAAGVMLTMVSGTSVSTEAIMGATGLDLPVLKAFAEISAIFTSPNGALGFLQDAELLIRLLVILIYAAMLLALLINILRALGKLNWLFKRRASYANGFNRNMYAMDDISKRYSSSLKALIICNLQIMLLSLSANAEGVVEQQITLFGYITLGVGLLWHFVCGLAEGTVTLFTTGKKIEEEERQYGLFIYFVRNLIQLVAVAAIVYFLVPQSVLLVKLQQCFTALLAQDFAWFGTNITQLIPMILELFAWIFIFIMLGHAVAATEFNRDGKFGKGMKTYAVASFLAFLFIGVWTALPFLPFDTGMAAGVFNFNLLIPAVIAFVVFLFDCICKSKTKPSKDEEEEDFYDPEKAPQTPAMGQVPVMNGQNGQPIYVPIYYYPYPATAQAPAQYPPVSSTAEAVPVRPSPMPAPAYIQPTPSPVVEEEEKETFSEEPVEIPLELDPSKSHVVRCPNCGKHLSVKEVSPYHRCPVCDKVFELRKFEAYVKKN